jgi:exonuclease III
MATVQNGKSQKGFRLSSYNCSGLNNSSNFIQYLLNLGILILGLQETWLLTEKLENLDAIHPDYCFHGQSGIDSTKDIITGRPYGGTAFLWHKSLSKFISPVPCSNKRVCALQFSSHTTNDMLFVNVYMPCDTLNKSVCQVEYLNVLDAIEELIIKYDNNNVVLLGDWNTDLSRNSAQCQELQNFIDRNNIKMCRNNPKAIKGDTYVNFALNHFSCIDHFIMSYFVYESLVECYAMSCSTNPSTHCPGYDFSEY